MGMIYQRGNVFWIKYYRNGKPYRESSRSIKEADAKRLLRKREGEIAQGKIPGFYFDKVKYDDLAADLEAEYEINNRKSLKRIKICIENLRRSFEGFRIVDINSTRIKAYVEKRQEAGVTNATINRELAALKRMLQIGAKSTPPKVDRVPYIPKLKESSPRKGFFEHGDFIALRDNMPAYLKGFLTFAYRTGWRLSEITGLKWPQVDLNQGIVTLNPGETKNDEGRTLYLDDELKGLLLDQWRKRKSLLPYVFLNVEGIDRVKRFDKAWRAACAAAKIGPRLFHDFRRTAVRNMIRAGVPERVAMQVSGHKTRSVFDRYNIVSDTDLKMAAQKQALYLESQKGTKSGTVEDFEQKKEAAMMGNPLNYLEAATGFEPVNNGFADRCLSHLAMPPLDVWSGRTDLNRRRLPWQGSTLPLSYARLKKSYLNNKIMLTCQ